jgi:hypothetical protein
LKKLVEEAYCLKSFEFLNATKYMTALPVIGTGKLPGKGKCHGQKFGRDGENGKGEC